jgi:phage terminase small subunit
MGGLTAKQEAFCLEYLKDLNATQAAIRAGYGEKNANKVGPENLVKLGVSERIAELMKERVEKTKIDAAWVLRQAVKVYDRCMQAEQVMVAGEPLTDADGNNVYKFEHSGANKALEIVGKHVDVQAFLDKSEKKITLTDDFDSLMGDAASDEE